jgi:hypothetical protein
MQERRARSRGLHASRIACSTRHAGIADDASMSRKRLPRPSGASQKPRAPGARSTTPRGRTARVSAALALAVLVAAAAWFATGRRLPWAGGSRAPADPLAALEPRLALETGLRLGGQGQGARSVPYFRRAVAGLPGFWEARYDLSSALANAAVESHRRLGRLDPVLRSSVERIGAIVESEHELVIALGMVNRPHNRAVLLFSRAQTYLAWGMPVDALALLREAQRADPAWRDPAEMALRIEAGLFLGGLAQ